MGFNEFIGKLFGNKQTRDIKEIQPWVEKIKAAYPKYEKLSNDELRAATQAIRKKVQDFVIPEKKRIGVPLQWPNANIVVRTLLSALRFLTHTDVQTEHGNQTLEELRQL